MTAEAVKGEVGSLEERRGGGGEVWVRLSLLEQAGAHAEEEEEGAMKRAAAVMERWAVGR